MKKGSARGHEAAAVMRREQALELRAAGMTYMYVAEKLGISKTQAWRDVQKAIKEVQEEYTENTKAIITIELKRLDRMLLALWTEAIKGNQGAIDRVVKIMERKSRLLGLDAPTKKEVKVEGLDIKIGGLDVDI